MHMHYMTKSMWTPAGQTSHSKIMGINMELFPLCCYNSLHFSGKAFLIDVGTLPRGTCFHSDTRALVRSDTDVGRLGLARSRRSDSSQRCSMGLRSGLVAGQSSSSVSTNHLCMDLALCTGGILMLKQERAFTKLLPQSWKHRII